jgi:hypothetical protein
VLDDYTPLRDVNENMLESGNVLFPVRPARWYVPRRPLGCSEAGCVGSQGDAFFTAPNPAFGANFTYYLAEGFKTSKDARREQEKELEAANEDVDFPSWDRVLSEQREDGPAIVFTIRNSKGEVVRLVEGPAEAGFHRVAWDLRYPSVEPWSPEEDQHDPQAGVLVVPGTFTVSMQKRIDGVLTELGQDQSFNVVSIRKDPVLPGTTQEQRVVFEMQADELIRAATGSIAAIDEVIAELDATKSTLERSMTDGSLYEIANSIQQRLVVQRDRLSNNEIRAMHHVLNEMTVQERTMHARFASNVSAYGPTPAQQESLRLARKLYDEVVVELKQLVETDYAGLKQAMDVARVPWTPGRSVQR